MPIAKIVTSEYGVAIALDIEGNCRVYDMIRLRKLCKISCASLTQGNKERTSWRLIPFVTLLSVHDSFLGAIQTDEISEIQKVEQDDGASVEADAETPFAISEKDLVVHGKYSDAADKLKSID